MSPTQNGDLTSDSEGDKDSSSFKFQDNLDRMEDDFSLECLGLLANLEMKVEVDFSRILTDLELLPWIMEEVLPKVGVYPSINDINEIVIMETIRLIATMCLDKEAAKLLGLGENSVVSKLINLMNSTNKPV